MSLRIPGQADRVYVPDAHGDPGYRPYNELVSMVRAFDKGPDVQLELMIRGIRSGHLMIPASDEQEMRRRLFTDPPPGEDEYIGALIQELEDLAGSHNIEGVRMARRRLVAFINGLRQAAASRPRPTQETTG